MTGLIPIDDRVSDGAIPCVCELFFNRCELPTGHEGHHRATNEDGDVTWNPDLWGDR